MGGCRGKWRVEGEEEENEEEEEEEEKAVATGRSGRVCSLVRKLASSWGSGGILPLLSVLFSSTSSSFSPPGHQSPHDKSPLQLRDFVFCFFYLFAPSPSCLQVIFKSVRKSDFHF